MKRLTTFKALLLFITCCLVATGIYASDLEKEKRWRDQIVDALMDGEAIDLHDGQHNFLAIYTAGESNRKTGLIIMHGTGIHPDYPNVINPLRVGLAEKGWNTLSLQLPVLPNEADMKDYEPLIPQAATRIRSGIEYLKQAGNEHVFIIGHSLGSTMAAHALAKNDMGVSGFIAIGMDGADAHYLKSISIPVLDLYGSNDLASVVNSDLKKLSAAAHNNDYTQIITKDADHFFHSQEDELNNLINNWLDDRAK